MTRLYILLALITISCGNKVNDPSVEMDMAMEDEWLEKEEALGTQNDDLLGKFVKEDLQKKPYSTWYNPRYEKFNPDSEEMTIIANNIHDYKLKVLMGTWCGDSKREIPKLLKILDEVDFNSDNLELIAVDHNKQTPSKIEEELDVQMVPTIIFFKNGKEWNRFVEYARAESIEEDIARIVSGEEYKNSYAD
ncbi:thioredoxin family protein [Christiangramia aquimixticola]|uniref:thioredoxin family protein n=1 Tax=Christiangramia aquimixticola TaxID=1697558 RepID=UPI003AA99121